MANRLPVPGQDVGTWGSILNSYLEVSHDAGGGLLPAAITAAGAAPLASPALTGVPTAPTAATGTKTGQIATTAFVSTAISAIPAGGGTGGGGISQAAADNRYAYGEANVRNYGAVGDGVTDDSAAFIACYAAASAATVQNPGFTGQITDNGRVKIVIPPGAYLIKSPNALMNATSGTQPNVQNPYGIVYEGAGRGLTTIYFEPTSANQTLMTNNNCWLGITWSGIGFISTVATASFMHSTSSAVAQDYLFIDCTWEGTWNYGFKLDGSNNNSEYKWIACGVHGTYGTAFLALGWDNAGGGEDQFLNYWFDKCKIEYQSGTFVLAYYGGNITVRDSSIILEANITSTLYQLLNHSHAAGVMRFKSEGNRYELPYNGNKLIYCEWDSGIVTFEDDDISAHAYQGSGYDVTSIPVRFSVGNNNGPVVTWERCMVVGRHQYGYTVGSYAQAQRITYRDCDILNYYDAHDFIVSVADDSTGNAGGAPAVRFERCRGGWLAPGAAPVSSTQLAQYPFDCQVNWEKATDIAPQRHIASFSGAAGDINNNGNPANTLVLPQNAMITNVIMDHEPNSSGDSNTAWTYTIQTRESTPTVLGSIGGGGTRPFYTSTVRSNIAVAPSIANTSAKRTIDLVITNCPSYGAGFFAVEYIA